MQKSSYHRLPYISSFGWLQPRLVYIRSTIPLPFACPHLRPRTTSRIQRYLKNVNATASPFPVLPLPPPPPPPFGLMDRPPSRTLDSPRQSRRRGTTPSISENPHPSQPVPVSGSTNTSLPSIRHLHPHLPPPNQYFGPSDPSAYPPSSFDQHQQPGSIRYQTQAAHQDPTKELSTIEESDSDKHSSPPPKKRRKRQALSCTGQ